MIGRLLLFVVAILAVPALASATPRLEVRIAPAVASGPVTGRVFVIVSPVGEPEPRLQSFWYNTPEFLGWPAEAVAPGTWLRLDPDALGYPYARLKELPPGDYHVQAVLQPYVRYPRADGHVIWALDQWEGQRFGAAPGTLYSKVVRWESGAGAPATLALTLDRVVPSAPPPVDTEWLRHVRIRSDLLSRFWGRPIYLGAVVLLPKGYDPRAPSAYPVIYQQQAHFNARAPFDFMIEDTADGRDYQARECHGCESGYQFAQAWQGDDFPRVVAIALQHPTPYGDYSAAVNSANNGPYADAIMTELIPYLERTFHISRDPAERFLVGKSLGGRDALSLQFHYPEQFAGTWSFYPWGISFDNLGSLDIYDMPNAFTVDSAAADAGSFLSRPLFEPLERWMGRTTDGQPLMTFRQMSRHDAVLRPQGGGEFGHEDAAFGPVSRNGLPAPLWDRTTGAIDPAVAAHWRKTGDLVQFLDDHWQRIRPLLGGKLHVYVGEMDEYFRQRGVHRLEAALRVRDPSGEFDFHYGPTEGHGWQPMTNAALVRIIAATASRRSAAR